jgi:hypothetical protein
MSALELPPIPIGEGLRLSPTDVSQFIRLEQCERYLRLRLHERVSGRSFLYDYDVQPQSIPPLLTRSGRDFEGEVEDDLRAQFRAIHLGEEAKKCGGDRGEDNERVLGLARALPPGEALILLQPRLRAGVEGWELTGDPDLLHLQRLPDGALRLLVTDLKSTARVKVEHRLQVAFYHEMLARLFAAAGTEVEIGTAILYRGIAGDEGESLPSEAEEAAPIAGTTLQQAHRAAAQAVFDLDGVLLEIIADPEVYRRSVRDLVTGRDSLAGRVAAAPFAQVPFHLTYKCDGCLYNEFCMKWSAEHDDLSLLPHLTATEKGALRRAGITRVEELARLKEPPPESPAELVPAPGSEALCRRLAVTWPVGPRLDELVHRARRYRKWKGDPVQALSYIPSKGYGSLPYADAEHNPNLVRVYLDAQHDYLHDRIYMLGALVVACEEGVPARRRSVVRLLDGPPDTAEKESGLFIGWVLETMRAVVELAAPDAEGKASAPLHLVFYNRYEQRLFLDGLSRHFSAVLGAAPLYSFITQLAAYDSPIATFLDEEIRELKNYPMVCQSLQAVARFLGFGWNDGEPFARIFRARLFDDGRNLALEGAEPEWYTGRARFNSQIPLEYVYGAWGELEEGEPGAMDPFRGVTPDLFVRFQERRLEALERVAADFRGNPLTEKRPFDLPDLALFEDRARSLAHALDEFVTIERHVELNAWKSIRHAPPERRVLMGETLLVRYREEDQEPGVAAQNRENERRRLLQETYRAAYREANPDAKQVRLPKEQKAECDWKQEGMRVRLRLETEGLDCGLEEALALMTLEPGARFVVNPRLTWDERLPVEERVLFTPTPKQMLYGTRASLVRLEVERDAEGKAVSGWAEVEFQGSRGGAWSRGFAFGSMDRPLAEGGVYSLDPCPNSWYGFWCARVTEGLCALQEGKGGGRNTLYERVTGGAPDARLDLWTGEAEEGQARFMAGLDALREAGALHGFEAAKREYIGCHGDAPILLVQGPPGTGKSYSTAFALFARMQGAMAAGREFRALVSCKTHAATDVLLRNVLAVREQLRALRESRPEIFARCFDARLLEAPLFRVDPRERQPEGIVSVGKEAEEADLKRVEALAAQPWCIAGATPGGIYKAVKERSENLFSVFFCDCLVLDEASQMNLPEAIMAALPLRAEGQLIVVGDHRQMPPIVQHDWDAEPRRSFQEYRAYESLFQTLLPLSPPMIRFEESFRLHADMAEFLRREIYQQDGIRYHSRRKEVLPDMELEDRFLAAVLAPEHPLVVIVHDEGESQTRNPFEQALVAPLLEALADPARYGLDANQGLGVVVPHRAQRAAMQLAFPSLRVIDPEREGVSRSAVDTVERFQGGERTVILVSATESDREYLLVSSKFLLDPRRLTVAVSRAKQKLVLVASRSVFSLFSADEETFAHALLWKNLLDRTCTTRLWEGEREGQRVEVWGNAAAGAG